MEIVPEDFASLKRPALQKLCKKFGIKANGKNVDMIKALEELRCSSIQENIETKVEFDNQLPETLPTNSKDFEQQPPSPTDKDEDTWRKGGKRQGRQQKRQTRKRSSEKKFKHKQSESIHSVNSECSQVPVNILIARVPQSDHVSTQQIEIENETKMPDSTQLPNEAQPVNVQPTASENESSDSTPTDMDQHEAKSFCSSLTNSEDASCSSWSMDSSNKVSDHESEIILGCKRKRRDTYSVSPKSSSFGSPIAKHPRLTFAKDSTSAVSSLSDSSEQISSPACSSASNKENLNISEMDTELNSEIPHFSPPVSGEKPRSSHPQRKRNSTFVLSTENTTDASSPVAGKEAASNVDEPSEPQTKRLRRETFSVSPKVSSVESDEKVVTGSNSTAVGVDGDDMKKAILDMLDKRVEERQADPNYKPVFTAATGVTSGIPLKSSTATKFIRVHQKRFSKMKSIVTDLEQKEKRAQSLTKHTPSCAKRSKSVLNEKPAVQKHKPSNIPKPVVKKTTTSTSSNFRPTVLTTKQASFNFTANKPSMNNKTPKNERDFSKTPAKTFAEQKTPGKISFDIHASLKRKPSYKPHTGKLPVLQTRKRGQ